TVSREPVACGEVVEHVLSALAVRIEETDALVTVAPLPTVQADASQLGQLFQNLIANALKFVGDSRPEVRVMAEREDAAWRFTVADNGLGIEPQHVDRIFDPFQRLHRRGDFPGSGIGLAICKRIVELYGGGIWAEAAPGGGSLFNFTIPDQRDDRASPVT